MKILMLLENDFPPDTRVEKEAISLLEGGHEVAIASICFTDKPFVSGYRDISIYKKRISRFVYKSSAVALQFPFYFNFWIRYIREVRKDFPFDVIHIHDLPLAAVGSRMKKKMGVKMVLDLHENYPALVAASPYSTHLPGKILISVKRWRKYEKAQLHFADQVVAVVEEMADRVTALGAPAEKVNIVPNLPSLEELHFVKEKGDENYMTLFYSGGINYHRGLQVILRALPGLVRKRDNIRLWIVGNGSYLGQLKDLARDLGVSDYIVFWGWKPHPEMFALLAKSDLALIPHLRSEQTDNSSPNKLFDYMYYEKPILASDCRSVSRILHEANCGRTYRDSDPDHFTEVCNAIIDHPDRKKMGEEGRKAVLEKYNWSRSAKALLALYKKLYGDFQLN